jgi:hypothetical protein
MTRAFLKPDDLHDLVTEQFGADRRLTTLERLTGGSKKGVYRLTLDDATTAILYAWATSEDYWPPSPTVPDDPFTDASGAELFTANHAALLAAGVHTPQLFMLDRDGRYLDTDIALVEDAGGLRLEALMERDPVAAAAPLSALGDAVRRMHTTTGPHYGKLALIAAGEASQRRRTEDIIVDRASATSTRQRPATPAWQTRTTGSPRTSAISPPRSHHGQHTGWYTANSDRTTCWSPRPASP